MYPDFKRKVTECALAKKFLTLFLTRWLISVTGGAALELLLSAMACNDCALYDMDINFVVLKHMY